MARLEHTYSDSTRLPFDVGIRVGQRNRIFGLTPEEQDEIEESEDPKDMRVNKLISNPERLLATILISNNLVNITMVVVLTFAISQTVEFNSTVVNFLVQTVLMTFLLLLFGEIFPKLVARGRTGWWVRWASPGIGALYSMFGPLAKVMVKSTSIVNRVVTKNRRRYPPTNSRRRSKSPT